MSNNKKISKSAHENLVSWAKLLQRFYRHIRKKYFKVIRIESFLNIPPTVPVQQSNYEQSVVLHDIKCSSTITSKSTQALFTSPYVLTKVLIGIQTSLSHCLGPRTSPCNRIWMHPLIETLRIAPSSRSKLLLHKL